MFLHKLTVAAEVLGETTSKIDAKMVKKTDCSKTSITQLKGNAKEEDSAIFPDQTMESIVFNKQY